MKYIQIQEDSDLPIVSKYAPFKAVVVVEDDVSDAWQKKVSAWIVESGCYYMMAWGKQCSSWDTSIDLANIEQFVDEIPVDSFVTTTWHDDEPLNEVFWFCKYTAFSDYHDFKNSVVIHVSKTNRCAEYTQQFENA